MKSTSTPWHFQRLIIYILAAILPPVMIGILSALLTLSKVMIHRDPPPVAEPLSFAAPTPGTDKKTALVLISNTGVQATELLTSVKYLTESGLFNVYVVAPEKELSPTTSEVSVFPHMTLEEAPRADVVLIPSLLDADHAKIFAWLKERESQLSRILALGEGVGVLAGAGFLEGQTAAAHFVSADDLRSRYPGIRFETEYQWIRTGKFLTSPGLLATPATIVQLVRELGAKPESLEQEKLGPSRYEEYSIGVEGYLQLFFEAAYDWSSTLIGVELHHEIDEALLSALLEIFPRSFAARSFTFNENRSPIVSKNGVILVPTYGQTATERPDFWVLPADSRIEGEESIPVLKIDAAMAERPFSELLHLLAAESDPGLARVVGKLMLISEERLGVPIETLRPSFQFWLSALIKILFLSAAGIAIAALFDFRYFRRAASQTPQAS